MDKAKEITEKTCARCEEVKPVTEYYSVSRSYCNECERITARERMKRYNATPRGKASQALNDSKKAVRKVKKETGRDILDDLTIYDVALVLGETECSYCGEDIPAEQRTLDHITPMRYGAGNTFSNITMACKKDNIRKSDKPAFEYFIEQGVPFEEFERLVFRISQRKGVSFGEAFSMLVGDVVTYYETMLEREKEKIEGNTD